jgi:hypothetical protein
MQKYFKSLTLKCQNLYFVSLNLYETKKFFWNILNSLLGPKSNIVIAIFEINTVDIELITQFSKQYRHSLFSIKPPTLPLTYFDQE